MFEPPEHADEPPSGQLLIYRDGATELQVRLDGQSVWLSQRLIAELFQVTVPTVNEHLAGIYDDNELNSTATIRKFRIVQTEGRRQVSRLVDHYNLEAILAVGYRVRSARGTQFRQWATARLSELLAKGFTLDDERIKAGRTLGDDYFDELLARIRDIRSSERMFYQKITDIYATSIDYDRDAEVTKVFFQTVQNKMHWAAHGHTAAEIVRLRADASRPHLGLTSWKNAPAGPVRKSDVAIAKNYLDHDEIEALNRIVSAYLEFAELQARNRRPMHMANWIAKLEDFLRLSDRDILTNAGSISHDAAKQHAEQQFAHFEAERKQLEASQPTSDFDKAVEKLRQIEEAQPAEPKDDEIEKKTKSNQDRRSQDSGDS
ncbi:MAG: virulence RhuM family protein [Pirellulales bacterium]|nr:virulence RhuM family protein [Pirellulales bacterium]